MGHLIILSAPSGSGKSTIVSFLLSQGLNLQFSISATSREARGTEKHGVEYYFLSITEFKDKIDKGEFLEFEEVYPEKYYGTLKSEVERIINTGGNVIFDVDVVGGLNIKKHYGEKALAIFIEPPSLDELKSRLEKRGTDSPETIKMRIEKAAYEMTFAPQFDVTIVNDNLQKAKEDTLKLVKDFLKI